MPLSTNEKKNEKLETFIYATSIDELLRKEVQRFKSKGFSDNKIIEYIFQNSLKNFYYYASKKDIPTKRIKFNKEHILNTLSVMYHEQSYLDMEEIQKNIKYNGKSFNESLNIFVKFLTPALKNDSLIYPEIVAKVLMHFIWQVKRKIANLKVQNHLCPVLINTEQGVGKTEFVKNFCKPFSNYSQFYALKKTSEVADTREIASNMERNILFLDELSSSEKSDISYLKSIITAEMLSPRILGTNRIIQVKNNATFIATANIENLSEKIKDETGNRRFFPIEVKSFKNVNISIESLNELNYLTESQRQQGNLYPLEFDGSWFWTLIDENWDCFLSLEELSIIQKKHTSMTDIEGFCDMFSLSIDMNRKAILVSDLFYVFKKLYPRSKFDQIKRFSQEITKRFPESKTNSAGNRKKDIGFHLYVNETFNEYLCRII
ncbi:VapE domain-containing protein [Silvanigrella sp.]|jgi:hypothetical protein|uniref:VapE domain-containing protein n=1 Tax=Silvanigrella sp. TaxID=2024976 RepID=UPI0037C65048